MSRNVKIYGVKFTLKKSKIPVIFIDTFFWCKLLKNQHDLKKLLEKCCKEGKILVATTNFLNGELKRHGLFEEVKKICGNSRVCINIGTITANQIIHSMIKYTEGIRESMLSWEMSISKVPILDSITIGLKLKVDNFKESLNKIRSEIGQKEKWISLITHVEQEFWMETMKVYGELLHLDRYSYEDFFYTDYFVDLPSIVIQSYLFGYILGERELKTQDVMDVYHISEIVPYTTISVIDKDQYNRCLKLKNDYLPLFEPLFTYVSLTSYHKDAPKPEKNLKDFLRSRLEKMGNDE